MTWSNLYLIELKYKLIILPSQVEQRMPYAIMASLILLSFFLYVQLLPRYAVWQCLLISIFSSSPFFFFCPAFTPKTPPFRHFLLNSNGRISVNSNIHYQIEASSKILYWGCLLVLRKVDDQVLFNKSSSKVIHYWVYKDNFDSQGYRRICRAILAVEQT